MGEIVVERFEWADDLSDADADALATTFNAVHAEWVAGERPISTAAFCDIDRANHHEPIVLGRWLARDGDGHAIGIAQTQWRDDGGPASGVFLRLLVHPDGRRRGAATALWRAVAEHAAANGRIAIVVQTAVGSVADELCRARGLRPDQGIEQNRCLADAAADELLQSWIARGEAARGYSILAWDGHCPDDLVHDFATAQDIMNDAPQGELQVDEQHSASELRSAEAATAAADEDWWVVAVRDDASGALIGLSEMTLSRKRPWIAFQGDTGVAAAHRGHGLGGWMKAVNHLRLRDERPGVEVVQTWNGSANEPMLRINRALGYEPVQRYKGWLHPIGSNPTQGELGQPG